MADEEFIISSLKRIYDECDEVLEKVDVNQQAIFRLTGIAEKYNETLRLVKDDNAESEIIQNLKEIEPEKPIEKSFTFGDNYQKIEKIKINTMTMADYMGVEMDDFQSTPSTDGLPDINIIQRTNVSQSVNIETILEEVERTPLKEVERDELRDLVKEYQDEVEKSHPDKSRLRELYEKMTEYSETVALQAGIYAMERGIEFIIG